MLHNGGYWGEDPAYHSMAAAFGNCVAAEALVVGGFGALVVAFLMFVPRGLINFRDFMGGVGEGVKSMVPADIILVLAWKMCIRDRVLGGNVLSLCPPLVQNLLGLLIEFFWVSHTSPSLNLSVKHLMEPVHINGGLTGLSGFVLGGRLGRTIF